MTRINLFATVVGVVLAMGLVACGTPAGSDAAVGSGTTDAAAGACPMDNPECVDTPQLNDDDPVPVDETGIKQLRRDAKFYLGRPQSELNEQIRIARVDDEQMMLTEDYRIGRITVELDTNDEGTPVVTSSTVELPDGPETFTLDN